MVNLVIGIFNICVFVLDIFIVALHLGQGEWDGYLTSIAVLMPFVLIVGIWNIIIYHKKKMREAPG